jgi:PilZ domain-containing protein
LTKEVTKFDKKSRRIRERIRLALPARIYGREGGNREWTEMTRLADVTPFGARFRLTRPIDIGRLLRLTLAMPRQLRVFDHVEDQYRIWAIVRNIRLLDPEKEKGALVEIGVAFIGKRPPKSYDEDPRRRYDIKQTNLEAELRTAAEDSVQQLMEMSTDDKRKLSRQPIPVEVQIEIFEENKLTKSESTVTENISQTGATVFTALDVDAGTFIRMSSERYNATVLAVVRSRQQGSDGFTRLHLEFIGGEWPL